MDLDYDRCFDETELWEGGYSNVPGDPGGATMRGLTQASYDAYRRSKGNSVQGVWRVTSAEIEDIFKNEYWVPARCSDLPVGLDMIQFDEAINSGPRKATELLQQALGLDPDGWFGLETLGRLKGLSMFSQRALIQEVCARRVAYWESLTNERKFLHGWLDRGKDVEAKALAMFDASEESLDAPAASHDAPSRPADATDIRPAHPDVHTISGLQRALKMLGYRVTIDGDYGPETRQAITSFQMHARIAADGIAGAQTEAQLINELNNLRLTEVQKVRPRP
jgi:lysozyme family protein